VIIPDYCPLSEGPRPVCLSFPRLVALLCGSILAVLPAEALHTLTTTVPLASRTAARKATRAPDRVRRAVERGAAGKDPRLGKDSGRKTAIAKRRSPVKVAVSRNALSATALPAGVVAPGATDTEKMLPPVANPLVTSRFGMRIHPITYKSCFHDGVDFDAERNDPVVSGYGGLVTRAGKRGGYGIAVEVVHPRKKLKTLVGHLTSVAVKPGQLVKQGQVIGFAGSTGRSSGTHVHLTVKNAETDQLLNALSFMNPMPEVGPWKARIDVARLRTKSNKLAWPHKRNRTLVAVRQTATGPSARALKGKRTNCRLTADLRSSGKSHSARAT